MKIKLTTGYEYDLSDADQVKKLNANINMMQSRGQLDRLLQIYQQVATYKNYAGNDFKYQKASAICQRLLPLLQNQIVKQTPALPPIKSENINLPKLALPQVVPAPVPITALPRNPTTQHAKNPIPLPKVVIPLPQAVPAPAPITALPRNQITQHTKNPIPLLKLVVPLPQAVPAPAPIPVPPRNQIIQHAQTIPVNFDILHMGIQSYLLVSAPLASSGDIYHVAAYLILLSAHKLFLPKVILTYDTSPDELVKQKVPTNVNNVKTFHHASQRAAGFLKGLGFGNFCVVQDISAYNKGAYYKDVREGALQTYLQQTYQNQPYLDQRATTTLVSWHMRQTGFDQSAKMIRTELNAWRNQAYFTKDEVDVISQYGQMVYQQIQGKYPTQQKQPFVVVQIRQSSGKGANNDQILPDDFTPQVCQFLEGKGIGVVLIYADSRIRGIKGYKDYLKFEPFSPNTPGVISPATADTAEKDLAKFFHLESLLQIYTMQNCKGIIGNTSGTLDIAAFVGHRVFNIHVFDQLPNIDYQDYRLLMQMVFLTIQASIDWKTITIGGGDQNQPNDLLVNLSTWILQGTRPSLSKKLNETGVGLDCFSEVKSSALFGRTLKLTCWSAIQSAIDHEVDFQIKLKK